MHLSQLGLHRDHLGDEAMTRSHEDDLEAQRRFWQEQDGDMDRWLFRGSIVFMMLAMVALILGWIPVG